MISGAAIIYAVLGAIVIGFQCALAAGAPWGHLAMGGRWPGVFPPALRLAAIFQAALVALFSLIVLHRAGFATGLTFPMWSLWPVLLFSTLAVAANLATPSRAERRLWAPVAITMWICSFWVWLAT